MHKLNKSLFTVLTLPKWRYRYLFLIRIWHELGGWSLWFPTDKPPLFPEVLLITKAFILVRFYSVSTGGKSNQTKLRQKELYGGFIISCNGKLQIWRVMAKLSLTSSMSQIMKISAVRLYKIKVKFWKGRCHKNLQNTAQITWWSLNCSWIKEAPNFSV